MIIEIIKKIGEDCLTLEDGTLVYNLIFPCLEKKEEVVLDFSNVGVFASPFFNASIGILLKDFDREILNNYLKFQNLSSEGNHLLRIVIQNSERFYKSDEKYRKHYEQIFTKQMEEK